MKKITILFLLATILNPLSAMSLTPEPSSSPSQFSPFFDDKHNPVKVDFPKYQKRDITPPPPKLNTFDKSILELCGDFGAKVKASDFKALLYKRSSAPIIKRIRQEVGCESFGACNKKSIIETLTAIWFKRRGFAHIFCGDPKADKMGGLHYVGRYLEMQQKAWGGPLSVKKGIEEIIPNTIYSLGVQHQWKGRTVETKIKGYAYSFNAADLLVHTTRAYAQLNPRRSKSKQTCLYTVPPEENTPKFQALLVVQNSSIVTFYPDATPGRTQQCD